MAQIQTPLLFNDHRIGLKIQYFPADLLEESVDEVCGYYLGMLDEYEKFQQDFPFMSDSCRPENLIVVFSMEELVRQIKFRTKLYELENNGGDH